MPTISDLKDQARTLEQQGQFEKALTIYQHILRHLEGTPALTKVLPLYVKAGDLLHKLEREEEAVASYQTAAEHYAATGAAPRVTALCGKIIRLVPERRDIYTVFVRQLVDHGHVGSARDVLADYARSASMDRAIETLDDLAGRPNSEVQPILERLLNSLEMDDESEQTAERLSSQLEEFTDSLAGELAGVPEASEEAEEEDSAEAPVDEEPDDADPLTPQLLDLDHMARQSSMHRAIRFTDEDEDEDEAEPEEEADDGLSNFGAREPDSEEKSDIAITRDVTPTMDGMPQVSDEAETSTGFEVEHTPDQAAISGSDELDSLLADAVADDDAVEAPDAEQTPASTEFEGSEWKPEFSTPEAEETVAAQWAPEEELQPAARYPSDEYDTPETDDELDEDGEEGGTVEISREESDALDDEISRAVEDSHAFAALSTEPEPPAEEEEEEEEDEQPTPQLAAEPEPLLRPTRPPQISVPQDSGATAKSPILFGVGGLVIGALAGAGLTFVLVGGGSGDSTATNQVQQPVAVVDTPVTRVEAPIVPEPEPEVATQTTSDSATLETPAVDTTAATLVDSAVAEDDSLDATPTAAAAEPDTAVTAPVGNPIIVDGMQIDEISEIEYDGRPGYRVVHLLDWGDPIVIEAVRDTSVTMSTFIQVNVTPPDTVVGIRRLDGYMVYASGVMPEDSLRSLMSRLVEGERQN